jgi:rubrerythrin
MTHRAKRFTDDRHREDRSAQRAVESRRRGDRLQIRVYHKAHITRFCCVCGYTTTKAAWLERCPLCRRTFATAPDAPGAPPIHAVPRKETT